MHERARNIRKSQRKSMENVAAITGLSASVISRFENGEKYGLGTAEVLAQAYGVPLSELMFGQKGPCAAIPYFLMNRGIYSDKFERDILSDLNRPFSEITERLSKEPVNEQYSAGYINQEVDYMFIYWLCKQLIERNTGNFVVEKKKLKWQTIDAAFNKAKFILPSFTWNTSKYKLSQYFYYDDKNKLLKSAMPTLDFYRIRNDIKSVSIEICEGAYKLIDWIEQNQKGEE